MQCKAEGCGRAAAYKVAEQTRNRLNALGLWPAGVPHLNDQQP